MFKILLWLSRGEEGQGMIEYGLILALLAVIVIGLLTAIGGDLQEVFTTISEALNDNKIFKLITGSN